MKIYYIQPHANDNDINQALIEFYKNEPELFCELYNQKWSNKLLHECSRFLYQDKKMSIRSSQNFIWFMKFEHHLKNAEIIERRNKIKIIDEKN